MTAQSYCICSYGLATVAGPMHGLFDRLTPYSSVRFAGSIKVTACPLRRRRGRKGGCAGEEIKERNSQLLKMTNNSLTQLPAYAHVQRRHELTLAMGNLH